MHRISYVLISAACVFFVGTAAFSRPAIGSGINMARRVSTCQIYSTASQERFRNLSVTVDGFISTSAEGVFISDSSCPNILIGLGVSDGSVKSNTGVGELLDYMSGKQPTGVPLGKRVKFTLVGKIEYHDGVPLLYVDSVASRTFVD